MTLTIIKEGLVTINNQIMKEIANEDNDVERKALRIIRDKNVETILKIRELELKEMI